MEWGFEFSLMAFLVIAFISEFSSLASRRWITLPLALGLLCLAGFGSGFFAQNFVEKSGLLGVGAIAYNVFVINAGTLVDFRAIVTQRGLALFTLVAVGVLTLAAGPLLWPVLGREIAFITPGAIIGNGAANAIASVRIMQQNPGLAVYPWLLFMGQGVVSIPLFVLFCNKACAAMMAKGVKEAEHESPSFSKATPTQTSVRTLAKRMPASYKTTAYTLGILMVAAVLNRWLHISFLQQLALPMNITALLFGIALGQLGIVDKNPLRTADCFGLLMLGLMALMANTLAHSPLGLVLSLLPAVALALFVGAMALVLVGFLAAKLGRFGLWEGMALGICCMVPFPASLALLQQTVAKACKTEEEKSRITMVLLPKVQMVSQLSTGVFSIFVASLMLIFL